jgi:DNA-binding MarR family transcriptional regulator
LIAGGIKMFDRFKRDMTKYEILLYEAIENSDDFVYSTREIADMLGCGISTVFGITKNLENKKLVNVICVGYKHNDKRIPLYKYTIANKLYKRIFSFVKSVVS